MATEDALNALGELIEKITQRQGDIALHRQNIALAVDAGLDEEAAAARELAALFVGCPADEVWIPLLAHKEKELGDTLDGVKEVHAMYQRAAQDFLSIPLLLKHVEFIVGHQDMFGLFDEDADEVETTRAALKSIAEKGASHLTEGHVLWDRWRDWEVQLLDQADKDEREPLIELIDAMYLERLQVPHSTHEETATAYSTFVSTYRPDANYENVMLAVTKARANSKAAWDAREMSEIALRNSKSVLDGYAAYLAEEKKRQPKPDQPQRKGRKPPARNLHAEALSQSLYIALHERAISAAASQLWSTGNAAEVEPYLRQFWMSYCTLVRGDPAKELRTLYRATRSVPSSGELWARYIRTVERHAEVDIPKESVDEIFTKALDMAVVKDSVEELVPFVLARADYERRAAQTSEDDEGEEPADDAEEKVANLVTVLEGGIKLVRSVNPKGPGDPRYRLEKYLAGVYQQVQNDEKAAQVWETTAKSAKTSSTAWSEYLRILASVDAHKARSVYKDIVGKNLDWPEMLWEQWLAFEHCHGSVEEVEDAISRVEFLSGKLQAKRAQEAAQYQSQYAAAAATATAESGEDAMQVDAPAPDGVAAPSRKRKADDEEVDQPSAADAAKRVKIDDTTLKRDRENSEVIVTNLKPNTTEADITKLFKDCGEIREIKLLNLPNTVATVEFMSRESVPGALTKDKKRINKQEIAVHASWKATLYVTNFPEETDDTTIRNLFEKYGALLDVRWPSKKFKSSRRFCYVQFTTPSHAQAALELHNTQLAPGMKLSVLISDPMRKKERTDADANEREVYIAGLSRFAKKEDLQTLFQQFGAIKDVRMALDDKGHSKGFAFVEFEDTRSANSALTANNHELKNRRIAVTMADARIRGKQKADTSGLGTKEALRQRSVRVRGLPADTQEGLLQQALEKVIEGIKRVEVFHDTGEALVELDSVAHVGKLMLRAEPVVFMEHELSIAEEGAKRGANRKPPQNKPPAAGASTSASGPSTAAAFVPRVASRPRAGIGSKPRAAIALGSATKAGSGSGAGDKTETDGGGKGQDDFRRMLGV